MEEKKEGMKFDSDKLRVELMPVTGLLLQADVYTRGAKKYDEHNWRNGIKWTRILGAMMRHLLWYMAGEQFDPEDGQHHLSSIAWGCNALMEYEITHPELDDRFIAVHATKIREMMSTMKKPKENK